MRRVWSCAVPAVAALLATLLVARAAAFTVDCDRDYADCEKELSKLTEEDDQPTDSPSTDYERRTTKPDVVPVTLQSNTSTRISMPTVLSVEKSPTTEMPKEQTEITTDRVKPNTPKMNSTNMPKGRLLNLSVDEFQSFANSLHNQSVEELEPRTRKPVLDLSDVSLDSEDDFEFPPHDVNTEDSRILHKGLSDSTYSNTNGEARLDSTIDKSDEADICNDNGFNYKTGEKLERGCDELCECLARGEWQCMPRCQTPFIRRGRRLSDPLCFETPVDECCSIIACATKSDTDLKAAASSTMKTDVCRYGNKTYTSGQTWDVGCDQRCSCGHNAVITCKPRCGALSPSEHCINVQDPHDACCHVQVCDVTHDAHEHVDQSAHVSASHTTIMEDRMDSDFNDLLVSTTRLPSVEPKRPEEPITSINVLKNNSVLVNVASSNSSVNSFHLQISSDGGKTFKDVMLDSGNILLNLEQGLDYTLKSKETEKRFNFMIPVTNVAFNDGQGSNDIVPMKTTLGCVSEGVHYNVGEEFRIGCSELCECVGVEQRECARLECPSNVGLELLSPSCVRWAPDPPDWVPRPPACCPTKMRCLSDGSCDYQGHKIPNWSEVPESLTGCEQRCFCETGTLDCQNICSPLPPLPPQTLRCQLGYKPAPVNISEDDCCKHWGCTPTANRAAAGSQPPTHSQSTHSMSHIKPINHPLNFVTPLPPPSTITPSKPVVSSDRRNPLNPLDDFQQINSKNQPRITYNSKFTEHTIPLLTKTNSDIHVRPKIQHSINFTKTIIPPHSPPYKFPGQFSDSPHSEFSSNGNLVAKSPTTNKGIGLPMTNHLSADHSASAGKLEQTDRPARYTTIKVKPLSNSAILPTLNPNPASVHRGSSPHSKHTEQPKNTVSYFEPNINWTRNSSLHSKHVPSRIINVTHKQSVHVPHSKHDKLAHSHIGTGHTRTADHITNFVTQPPRISQIPQNAPNPYQSILHHSLNPEPTSQTSYKYDLNSYMIQDLRPTYIPSDVEELLRQLEQTGHGRRPSDLSDRPTPDSRLTASPNHTPDTQMSAFIPTAPPEIPYQTDRDFGDIGQNNDRQRPQAPPKAPPPFQLPALLPPGGVEPADNKKLSLMSLVADAPNSVKMLFELPPVLVGLRGSVDLRYTDTDDEDISHWYSQVFAPTDEILTTARLEFRLTGLKPSTTYKIRGKLYLLNLPLEPVSDVFTVRTLDAPQVMEEKRRAVETGVRVHQVNATAAQLSWRHFTEDELQYIDGIQVRYRPQEQPIYSMTELLHHGRVSAELLDLRPGSLYEASLVLVPPPRSPVELYDPATVNFTTPEFYDMYNWSVSVETRAVGAESAEVTWRGVPAPPERYVRVYRAAHSCDDQAAHPHSTHEAFKLADRDQPPTLLLTGLRPNTKCRVWLELFLTNGKVKISNVLDVITKVDDSENTIDNEVQASSVAGSRSGAHGDYYSALVVVGVVAALGTLTSLLLLLVVMRRHRPHTVSITTVPSAPRGPALPPYDNPAYKLELQQETMDL